MPKCHFKIQGQIFLVFQKDDEEPKSIFEALSCTVKKNQKIAMAEEIESIKSNQIWDLVDLSIGRKAIWNKQVLQIKQKANGTIERYKVGLVAKDYNSTGNYKLWKKYIYFTSSEIYFNSHTFSHSSTFKFRITSMNIKDSFSVENLMKKDILQPVDFIKTDQENQLISSNNQNLFGFSYIGI